MAKPGEGRILCPLRFFLQLLQPPSALNCFSLAARPPALTVSPLSEVRIQASTPWPAVLGSPAFFPPRLVTLSLTSPGALFSWQV